ncbi:polyserase-2-like [Bubalus bubalis]|uniref:polyserase-2-like n=1 Tax=Bubalus bubalis TaxID=89462 RepID=UPI001D11AE01|nr:polyserase-2-like [Bubalus bubalis]
MLDAGHCQGQRASASSDPHWHSCPGPSLGLGSHRTPPGLFPAQHSEGDSGGPLVCLLRDQRWAQVAVVSFSGVCAEPSHLGVCTNVSTCQPWIRTSASCQDTCVGADPSPGHGLPFSRHLLRAAHFCGALLCSASLSRLSPPVPLSTLTPM